MVPDSGNIASLASDSQAAYRTLPASAPPSSAPPMPVTPVASAPRHHMSFRAFLSELNPLQYLPVVGTIYRSMTGDTIPEDARLAGSLVVSGLMGGPVGLAMNVASVAVEKATGIDPEKIGQRVLASLGLGSKPAAVPSSAPVPPTVTVAATPPPAAPTEADAPKPWSRAQLAAYGVTITADGSLRRGALQGSDVLNDLELGRQATRLAASQPEAAAG